MVYKWGSMLTLILIPIWPLLALAAGVFPKGVLLETLSCLMAASHDCSRLHQE